MTTVLPAPSDVCLLLEGTYPYTHGGVSTWVHDLVGALGDLTFRIVALLPGREAPEPRYELPRNVTGVSRVFVRSLSPGSRRGPSPRRLVDALRPPLLRLQEGEGGLREIAGISRALGPHRGAVGARQLLDSPAAWGLLGEMCRASYEGHPFLDYFWAWRCLQEGLFSAMLAPLPPARVYHTVSTGYAGLLAARARIETGRPVLLTEHGIYTNERRVEIAMADWLHETPAAGFDVAAGRRTLGDFWTRNFASYARACYEACDPIVTLFEGNQRFQRADGAPPERLRVIPNGIDFPRFARLWERARPHPPTIALIGRIVPIKDIKTFLRACALLRRAIPGLQAWLLGSADEDPGYAQECRALAEHLGLADTVTFHGQVRIEDRLAEVDVVVLTSISEAQPLVILEAGAAGIPIVATDVGSCRELILGRPSETPTLGPGGAVTRLADPSAVAEEVGRLLTDPAWRASCSRAIQERVRLRYNKPDIERTYRELYGALLAAPGGTAAGAVPEEGCAWPA